MYSWKSLTIVFKWCEQITQNLFGFITIEFLNSKQEHFSIVIVCRPDKDKKANHKEDDYFFYRRHSLQEMKGMKIMLGRH